jgi:hypothetical protein
MCVCAILLVIPKTGLSSIFLLVSLGKKVS